MRISAFRRYAAVVAAGVFLVCRGPGLAGAGDVIKPEAPAASSGALRWMRAHESESGALPGFGGTADGIYAVVAGGQDPASDYWSVAPGTNPLTYLQSESESYDCDQSDRKDCNAGRAAKAALAAVMTGRDPRSFGGNDLIAAMMADTTGTGVTASNFSQGYAILALAASGAGVPPETIPRVTGMQQPDGGWGFSPGAGSDTNSTALLVQALIAAGPGAGLQRDLIDRSVGRAMDYLSGQQKPDGGFAYQSQFEAEPVSTAGVIMAVRATSFDPKVGRWQRAGVDPVGVLLGFQKPDGSFASQLSCGTVCAAGNTSAAVPAVVEKSLVCLAGLGTCPVSQSEGAPPDAAPANDDSAIAPEGSSSGSAANPEQKPAAGPSEPPAMLPVVWALVPDHGPLAGGTRVLVRGKDLVSVDRVRFGPSDLVCPSELCRKLDSATIRLTAPPGPDAGPVPVTAGGPGGSSNPLTFTYKPEPGAGPPKPGRRKTPGALNSDSMHTKGSPPGGGGFTPPGRPSVIATFGRPASWSTGSSVAPRPAEDGPAAVVQYGYSAIHRRAHPGPLPACSVALIFAALCFGAADALGRREQAWAA